MKRYLNNLNNLDNVLTKDEMITIQIRKRENGILDEIPLLEDGYLKVLADLNSNWECR